MQAPGHPQADYACRTPQSQHKLQKPPVTDSSSAPGQNPPMLDISVPHSARVWNYWLGGKDNYPVDREIGDQIRQLHPGIGDHARADRVFRSHLVLSHTITSPAMPDVDAAVAFWNEHGTPKLTQRTPEQIARFFDGLELVEPGVVSCSRWRPDATPWGEPDEVAMFGGVGRKP